MGKPHFKSKRELKSKDSSSLKPSLPSQLSSSSSPSSSEHNDELHQLLKKLRPFQMEAYEFATQGVVSPRMKQQNQNQRQQESSSSSSPFEYDPDLLGKGRILLADEMGLGKSVTSLAIMAHYRQEWPLLIFCPASLRHTWPGEIEKFLPAISPNSVYVVSGFNDIGFAKRRDVQVVVATYSLLQSRSAVAQLLLNPDVDEGFHPKCIIVDESHNLKQKNSQRSKIALPILKRAKRLLLLSGTPALARPVELWLQLHVLAPDLFGKYSNYTKEHCDAKRKFGHWDVSGLSNAQELHRKLKQVMVRRLKCDVLHELPAKQRMLVPIKVTAASADKERIAENKQVMQDLKDTRMSLAELVGDNQQLASIEAKRLFNQAYQASGIVKAGAVADYLVDWIGGSGSQKVLVFAHHKAVMDTLELAISKHLKGIGHIRIDGSVNSNDRAKLVRKFQTSPQVRVGLLSMTAAGVGLTLTAASNVMFAELHYTPGVLAQAEDRAHRIGQRNAVNIMYFVCRNEEICLDNAIWKMLGRKVGTLEQVIDGGDGSERVALSAKEAKEVKGKCGSRQSVHEELSNFFAETASNNQGKMRKKVEVKGSILSFFKKASSPASAQDSKATTAAAATTEIYSAEKSTNDNIEWNCKSCTYVNTRKRSNYMPCEICNELYVDEACPRVTPKSAPIPSRSGIKSPLYSAASKLANENSSIHTTPLAFRVSAAKLTPSKEAVVVGDDDDVSIPVQCKIGTSPQDALVINDSDDEAPLRKRDSSQKQSSTLEAKSVEPNEILTFSVSKNSGRITLHYKEVGTSSLVNFDVHDVLSEETVNALADAQTTRASTQSSAVNLVFNQGAIQRVIEKLDSSSIQSKGARKQGSYELEAFVRAFLSLREVERKAIKNSGEAFSPRNLAQAATKIILGLGRKRKHDTIRTIASTTDRYVGGAKELAEERLQKGEANTEDMAVLKGYKCAWCASDFSAASRMAQSTYCSQECAEEGRLRRGGKYASSRIREQIFALEGGVCQLCHLDAHALFLRIKSLPPAQRLSALCNAGFKLPSSSKALERLLHEPKEGFFWQADHIQPVAEGGGGCGLENLRTLCTPCHSLETQKLRGRLKLNGGGVAVDEKSRNDGKKKQTDIRSMFLAK